jgi:tRNA nucleotidyltransferase (CCA-adding enzyme)
MAKLRPAFRDKALFVRLFGADVYAVGGYVRDLVRGVPTEDVDLLVCRRSPDEIVRRVSPHGRVDLVGKSFGIIKLTVKGRTYDLALPRRDAPAGTGVRGHKDIAAASDPDLPVEKDLERRDFRCNSMALRLRDGALVDPFGGLRDIRDRVIRLTNPDAFPDDPLRVLRTARFASVLGFKVDPAVYPVAKDVDLAGLSVERVNEELFKILLNSPRPSRGLEELFRLGVLRKLFPELYGLTLSLQDAVFHPEKDEYGHHTVWSHTKLTVDHAKTLAGRLGLPAPRALALLLAALYHDAGKPGTAHWEFKRGRMVIINYGHDLASEKTVRRAFRRHRIFSWNGVALDRIVPVLIKTHHRAGELWQNRDNVTRRAFSRLAADAGGEIELVVALDAADRAGRSERRVRGWDREARWLFAKFEELRVSRETIKPLLLGRDLIKLGVAAGPGMGALLKKLYELQLDSRYETRTEGLKIARTLVEGGRP